MNKTTTTTISRRRRTLTHNWSKQFNQFSHNNFSTHSKRKLSAQKTHTKTKENLPKWATGNRSSSSDSQLPTSNIQLYFHLTLCLFILLFLLLSLSLCLALLFTLCFAIKHWAAINKLANHFIHVSSSSRAYLLL